MGISKNLFFPSPSPLKERDRKAVFRDALESGSGIDIHQSVTPRELHDPSASHEPAVQPVSTEINACGEGCSKRG